MENTEHAHCNSCGKPQPITKKLTAYKDGSIHMVVRCTMYDHFIKTIPREIDSPGDFIMPFGKYRGLALKDINEKEGDSAYLQWCLDNFENGTVRRRIEEYIENT